MIFVDTHAHLNFESFTDDLPLVLDRSLMAGIKRMLIPGTDLETSKAAVELSMKYKMLYAAVGFHPNDANKWTQTSLHEIEQMLSCEKVIAIGEIGLDNYRERCPLEVQKNIFRSQVELAHDHNLPIIIHNRCAFWEIWSILSSYFEEDQTRQNNTRLTGIFHAFSESAEIAQKVTNLGFQIGIGGAATYPKAQQITEVIRYTSIGQLVLETDSPFLSPQPYRGKRNEPSNIVMIAQKIAEIKEISLDDVAKETTQNTLKVLNWSNSFE